MRAAIPRSACWKSRTSRLKSNGDANRRGSERTLAYLRSNQLSLLKPGVYTPQYLTAERNKLEVELAQLLDQTNTSRAAMRDLVDGIMKISELLKMTQNLYDLANPVEEEVIGRTLLFLCWCTHRLVFRTDSGRLQHNDPSIDDNMRSIRRFRMVVARLLLRCRVEEKHLGLIEAGGSLVVDCGVDQNDEILFPDVRTRTAGCFDAHKFS